MRYFPTLIATAVAAIAWLLASDTRAQTYDFSRFLSEPHPFDVRPAPPPPPAAPQTIQPVRDSRATRPAQPVSETRVDPGESGERWWRGLYGTVNLVGGYSWMRDAEYKNGTNLVLRRDEDWVGGNSVSLGYDWLRTGVPIRSEIEALIRYRFDLDYRGTAGGNTQGYTNEVATLGAMFNLYYDFRFLGPKWRPYLGAGVGFARHWSQSVRNTVDIAGDTRNTQDTRTNNLAWAAMAGFVWHWRPEWGLRVEGRYTDLGDVVSGPFASGEEITTHYTTVDLVLGVMYQF